MGHLELLLVENFKSWRGRQLIGPFKRFTCVIGPNGSGKSNVMDALSFVMGEKTANLRVKNIQELIHGAHIGRPVSSSASVKIVYVEAGGEEKTFARIIRGGCSEFRFNDSPVSRSAYLAELEKIGIVVKAQNCLVFQGTVESISMKKPKERTHFFEEISTSGELIGEYEEKKRKLQKAEEDAQFNFNKKKNVAAERKHAKLEKEEAERYQSLLEELRLNKTQLQLSRLYHNERKAHFLTVELEHVSRDLSATKESLSRHEDMVKAKKKEHGALTRQLQQTEKELKALEALLNQKRPQYIKAKENTSHHLQKLDMARKCIKDSEKQRSKQEDDIRALEAQLADLDGAWRSFEKQIEEEILRKGRDIELEASQLEHYKELKEQVRKKVAIMTQQLEKLQWAQRAEEERLAFEKRRHGEVQGNLKQIKEQIEDHKKRVEKLEEYTKACSNCLEDKKQQEETLSDDIAKTKSRMSEVNEELNLIREELQDAGIDNHEGKRQRRRAEVLEHLKRLYPDSVFGRLLDLCHPIHKKYQLAVTKLFGRYMVAIVVTSEKVAKDCIRFLKEERAEPETFLALDYLDIKPINERLREIKGCKMVIDVIKTQFPQLKKVIQFVCGNGLVCETVEEARHVAFGGPERRKTVALDGTLFLKSGVISGGSSDLRHKSRYWDEKELKTLRDKRGLLVQELKDLMKTLRKETDLKQIQTLIQGTQVRLKYSQTELEMIKKKHLAAFYRDQSQLQSELLNIESQCTMLNQGIQEQQRRVEEFRANINKVEDDIFLHFCEEIGVENIREFENKHVKQQQEIDQKRLEFEKQKTRLNVQLEYNRNQLKKKLAKISTLKETLQKDMEDIGNLTKAEENCLQMVNELTEKRQQLKDVCDTQSASAEKVQMQIEEGRSKFLAVDKEVGKLQKKAVIIQSSLEQKRLEKHNVLLDCKVQDIDIVLLLGSLDDIIDVELGTDTESTQATTDIYEKEEAIEIDYSSLRADLKALQSDEEVEAHLRLLLQQVASQEDVLLKTAAPNLRALENLKTVRDKFQESTDAFEASRREARMCRQEFEQVKKRRCDLFSQCFEHVSVSIDQIYKKLCRNASAQVASYIKQQTQEQSQMIIISLKEELYSKADALIGIYPEHDDCMFSRILTLDLSQYPDTEGQEGSRHDESR
ncbi:structural maintenance of chromosomes protein 1B isoform X2 [Ochotona curzoniae]|uniref:structural maintenance of chromosomes protein 1B isoform X2 n=1 Tax=Ochotona curzoniae TaxID=130825 RepID=UPI001B347B5C|nr:structural maintenance of chromosomes protein 1B isoform X2 [Ochotona curzoniae]